MMKSILILNWRCPKNPDSGGAEKVTLEHAKAWRKAGYKVVWLAGNYPGGKKIEKISGVTIERYGSPLTIYFLAPFIYWLKFKARFSLVIDEIHGIPFLTPLWAFRSKKLAFIHEVAQEIWEEMLPPPISTLGKLYEKIYFRLYSRIKFMTDSNSTKDDLVKFGTCENKISVIPCGIDLKFINRPYEKQTQLTLLYIARLVRMKGIEDTLYLFSEIKTKIHDTQLVIVGEGSYKYLNHLKRLCTNLGISDSVAFRGYIDEEEKLKLYQTSHFLVHTSVREGFGLVVIEANSQGAPVIAYNSPGLKDIVQNKVNGYTFQRKDFCGMREKIVELYLNKKQYQKLSQSSIKYAKKYRWDKILPKSIQLIKKITKE